MDCLCVLTRLSHVIDWPPWSRQLHPPRPYKPFIDRSGRGCAPSACFRTELRSSDHRGEVHKNHPRRAFTWFCSRKLSSGRSSKWFRNFDTYWLWKQFGVCCRWPQCDSPDSRIEFCATVLWPSSGLHGHVIPKRTAYLLLWSTGLIRRITFPTWFPDSGWHWS